MLKLTNHEIMDLIPKDLKSFGTDKGWKVYICPEKIVGPIPNCRFPAFIQQINGRPVVVHLTSKPSYISIQSIRRQANVFRHLPTNKWIVDHFAPGTTFLSIWSAPYASKFKAIQGCLLYCVIGPKALRLNHKEP